MESNAPRRPPGQSRSQAARLRLARRRLRRSHVKALRMVGPGTDLSAVLAAVGSVDILPAATIAPGQAGRSVALSDSVSDTSAALSDTWGTAAPGGLVVPDSVDAGAPLPVHRSDAADGLSDIPSAAPIALSDVVADRSDARGAATSATLARVSDTLSDSPAPLMIAVELVRHDPAVSGARIAVVMREHGHTVTDRIGLRWRDRWHGG
jgi:hypothetical protein